MSNSTFWQLGTIVLYSASRYFLLGYAFALLYRCVRYVDFVFGTAYVLAPFVAYLVMQLSGSVPLSLMAGLAASPLILAPIMTWLSKSGGGSGDARVPENVFVISLGVFIVFESAIGFGLGDAAVPFVLQAWRGAVVTSPVSVSAAQIATIFASFGVVFLLRVLLRKTDIGLRLRALQESEGTLLEWGERLSALRGWAYAASYFAAGLAGILMAVDVDPEPRMGLEANLIGVFVALFARGKGSAAMLAGAFIIAAIEQTSTYLFGGLWKVVVLFAAIIVLVNLRRGRDSLISVISGHTQLRV